MEIQALLDEYQQSQALLHGFGEALVSHLGERLDYRGIGLAVPLHFRVKSWPSIVRKVQGEKLNVRSLRDVADLVGLRLIVVLSRDLQVVREHVDRWVIVVGRTLGALGEQIEPGMFDYQSDQFLVEMRPEEVAKEKKSNCSGLRAEIQLRTAAQHAWAAASHDLHYKREGDSPKQMVHALRRVMALVQLMDRELMDVMEQRDQWRESLCETDFDPDTPLDVDAIEIILDATLPEQCKTSAGKYSDLLDDLLAARVTTVGGLKSLLMRNMDHIEKMVKTVIARATPTVTTEEWRERISQGWYYSQTGLVRSALIAQFGRRRRPGT